MGSNRGFEKLRFDPSYSSPATLAVLTYPPRVVFTDDAAAEFYLAAIPRLKGFWGRIPEENIYYSIRAAFRAFIAFRLIVHRTFLEVRRILARYV